MRQSITGRWHEVGTYFKYYEFQITALLNTTEFHVGQTLKEFEVNNWLSERPNRQLNCLNEKGE